MVKFKVNTESFIKCISFVSTSAPVKDSRKHLNSIQLTFSEHKALVFVATNGHHLSTVKLSVDDQEGEFKEGFEFLIPTESVKQIKTVFGKYKNKHTISIQLIDDKMTIEGVDKTSVIVNCLETGSRYPDTSRLTKIVQDDSLPSRSYARLDPDYVSKLAKAFNEISEDGYSSVEITFPKVSSNLVLFTTQTTLPENVFEPISVLMPLRT